MQLYNKWVVQVMQIIQKMQSIPIMQICKNYLKSDLSGPRVVPNGPKVPKWAYGA